MMNMATLPDVNGDIRLRNVVDDINIIFNIATYMYIIYLCQFFMELLVAHWNK